MRPFFRRRVSVIDRCELACLGCELLPRQFSTDLLLGRLANLKPIPFIPLQLDLVGGDPLLAPDRIKFLIRNRPKNVKINVWTHGTTNWESANLLLPEIDHVFLFVPQIDRDRYREFTGFDRFSALEDTVEMLREANHVPTIVQTVTETDVNLLADDYDWIVKARVEWLLINPNDTISSTDSRDYLNRFNQLPNCYVIHDASLRVGQCLGANLN